MELGKNHETMIERACEEAKKIIMKTDHTPAEVDAAHDWAEVAYYLTVMDAMNEATEKGFSMDYYPSMAMPSMRLDPIYDRGSMEGYSRDGRIGRDGDSDGRYSERRGGMSRMDHERFPGESYARESERYPEHYYR